MGRPGVGVPGPQDFGGRRAAAAFTRGRHSGLSSPTIIKELQAFLGLVNFYRRFLPSIARTLRPLTEGLHGRKKGADKLEWLAMDAAFAGAKQALLSATHLAHPTVGGGAISGGGRLGNACGGVIAAAVAWPEGLAAPGVLLQEAGSSPAKVLRLRQGAICLLFQDTTFPVHVGWQVFAIFTDHKLLAYALARVSDPWTAHQSRQLCYVAEYTSDNRHIAGAANVVADTLSRPPGYVAAEGPPSVATCVKAPSGSQVVALQRGKLNSSPPSLPSVEAGVADVQPAVGVSFHRMAANQVSCPSTLQASKSSSLTVRTVQVEGASLL
jgi:hypothetical protein